jgi:hypothetical protein
MAEKEGWGRGRYYAMMCPNNAYRNSQLLGGIVNCSFFWIDARRMLAEMGFEGPKAEFVKPSIETSINKFIRKRKFRF